MNVSSMVDTHSPEARRRNMQNIRAKNTKPEITVRRIIHSLGYRFRLHRKDLPGKPDIVLPRHRKVILVNGCFWHLHKACGKNRVPSTRRAYWEKKLNSNRQRDAANIRKLRSDGWIVKIVWECQINDVDSLASKLSNFLTAGS